MNKVYQGDCRKELKKIPDQTVDCCITSPPYYGLRDYGVDGQIGLEETPEEYIENLVKVFREVKRVLKDDGTLWVNIGDSYAGGQGRWGGTNNMSDKQISNNGSLGQIKYSVKWKHDVIKIKDLIGIPWMLAFALRADGWYLRQDIIWSKPNPMPESVKDRCTKSHEYIFLLSKKPHYYFDYESIKETAVTGKAIRDKNTEDLGDDGKRNKRDVWNITLKPIKDAHFATFPEELVKPCILAGSRPKGIVLDPFFGSGTTGKVAAELNREYIGVELNPDYIEISNKRTNNVQLSMLGLV